MEKLPNTEIDMIPISEASKMLKIGVRTLWRWSSSGKFPEPDLKIGKVVRWKRTTIAEWINNQKGEKQGMQIN